MIELIAIEFNKFNINRIIEIENDIFFQEQADIFSQEVEEETMFEDYKLKFIDDKFHKSQLSQENT